MTRREGEREAIKEEEIKAYSREEERREGETRRDERFGMENSWEKEGP